MNKTITTLFLAALTTLVLISSAMAGGAATVYHPLTGEAVGTTLTDGDSCFLQDGNVVCPSAPTLNLRACIQECICTMQPGPSICASLGADVVCIQDCVSGAGGPSAT